MTAGRDIWTRNVYRAHRLVYGRRRRRFIAQIQSRVPEYAQVLDALVEGGATGARWYPWRELDLLKVLDRVRPKRIVELGTGGSSAVFAAWVRGTEGASLVSYDHSQQWAELTAQALEGAGFLPHSRIELRVVPMRESDRGSAYDMTLEAGIDLLYVDGPPVLRRNGPTANQDAIEHLDSGGRPRAIMVDMRIATVDALRIHPAAAEYSFTPGFIWLAKSKQARVKDLAAFGAWHQHSVFTRKPDIAR